MKAKPKHMRKNKVHKFFDDLHHRSYGWNSSTIIHSNEEAGCGK